MKSKRDNAGKFISNNATKGKIVLAGLVFLILTSICYRVFENTIAFFKENTIINHQMITVKFHTPIEIVSLGELDRRAKETKMIEELSDKVIEEMTNPIETQEVDLKNITWFWDIIWNSESTRGTNNTPGSLAYYCEQKGMWNELGFNPQGKQCFNDKDHAKIRLALWIADNCKSKSKDQCLCFYNTGRHIDTCAYSQGNLSLAN